MKDILRKVIEGERTRHVTSLHWSTASQTHRLQKFESDTEGALGSGFKQRGVAEPRRSFHDAMITLVPFEGDTRCSVRLAVPMPAYLFLSR